MDIAGGSFVRKKVGLGQKSYRPKENGLDRLQKNSIEIIAGSKESIPHRGGNLLIEEIRSWRNENGGGDQILDERALGG